MDRTAPNMRSSSAALCLALLPAAEALRLCRRAAVLTAAPLVSSSLRPASAASPVREGMAAFSAGKVEESIALFDSVIAQQPSAKPYLWQRGLSLCTPHPNAPIKITACATICALNSRPQIMLTAFATARISSRRMWR